MNGIIALDIDGTITNQVHSVPEEVVRYLASLERSGWKIVFATGRSFSMAKRIDAAFSSFPHYLALYNGAQTILMPDKKIINRHYLAFPLLKEISGILVKEGSDCVVYTGMENEDICYWRPRFFNEELRRYLRKREKIFGEDYREVKSFAFLKEMPLVALKSYGTKERCERVVEKVSELSLHATIVNDPITRGMFVLVLTAENGEKGRAVAKLREEIAPGSRIIAAGNDLNDISMLSLANIACVIDPAPEEVRRIADIVAPGVEKLGIISALKEAVKWPR